MSDMQRPRLSYADPPRARSVLQRVASDGLAAAAAFAAASFFAVNDTHRPKMFVLSSPFPALLVKVVTKPVFAGKSSFIRSVCDPLFHALHHCAAFFGVADGSAA